MDLGAKPIRLVGRKHEALHKPAEIVVDFDEDLQTLARRMRATLLSMGKHALALAAPQVGHPVQLVLARQDEEIVAIVNPAIATGGKLIAGEERCLSIPGRLFEVPRHQHAVVVGRNLDGVEFGCDAADRQARMWQHEVDHLNGLLLIGRFPEVRRTA